MFILNANAGGVFPTRVGMNRPPISHRYRCSSVPHPRGDEPAVGVSYFLLTDVFPTRVGMNRITYVTGHGEAECSPPAWG